jgi:hypothetical protein
LAETLYVTTNQHGTQLDGGTPRHWPLPETGAGQEAPGAELAREDGHDDGISLRGLEGLLDVLSDRVFVAEALADQSLAGAAVGRGVIRVSRARLLRETRWGPDTAALFALDCAEHVLKESGGVRLRGGATLSEVVAAARKWLETADESQDEFLHGIRQMAVARRLRRQSAEIGDLTFDLTIDDEVEGLEATDDPATALVAATMDAVLAAVEAIQHSAFPHIVDTESGLYEAETRATGGGKSGFWPRTEWIPAAAAARDCAERARQAARGDGEEELERAWQAERLASALGEAAAVDSAG